MEEKQQEDALQTIDGQMYEIPEEGSLGLLALGYHGIMAWRAKKLEMRKKREAENEA